jgi:hypothetical protein
MFSTEASGGNKDKSKGTPNKAQSFAATLDTTAAEASLGEEGTSFFTSSFVPFTSQDSELGITQVFKASCMATEEGMSQAYLLHRTMGLRLNRPVVIYVNLHCYPLGL